MIALLIAAVVSAPSDNRTDQQAGWIEGEAWHAQVGSVGPDRPPYASRGECLGSEWGGDRNDSVAYRFCLNHDLDDAVASLRYARLPASDSTFDLIVDGKRAAERLTFPGTGGWGHRRDDEWQYRTVPIGPLGKGWHELKLVALADRNNTNLDGFFLAGESFRPPNLRSQIETYPQPALRSGADRSGPDWVDDNLALEDFVARVDDWYYPSEEPAERSALKIPVALQFNSDGAELSLPGGATTAGVTIDGVQDSVSSEIASWEAVHGTQGTLLITNRFTTTASGLATTWFHRDQTDPPEDQCWGDDHYYGASGAHIVGPIANTDPASPPFATLTGSRTIVFLPGTTDAAAVTAGATAVADDADHPITLAAAAYTP